MLSADAEQAAERAIASNYGLGRRVYERMGDRAGVEMVYVEVAPAEASTPGSPLPQRETEETEAFRAPRAGGGVKRHTRGPTAGVHRVGAHRESSDPGDYLPRVGGFAVHQRFRAAARRCASHSLRPA